MYYGYVLCIHMPKVTIWIRNEDYETWKALKSKPEFIHSILLKVKAKTSKEVRYVKVDPYA